LRSNLLTKRDILKQIGIIFTGLSLSFPPLAVNETNIQKSILLRESMIHPLILNTPQQILEDLKTKNQKYPLAS
jgi:hypothetical protein